MTVSEPDQQRADATRWFDWRTIAVAAVMVLVVIAVYLPWSVITGETFIVGADHTQLHARRMRFANEYLSAPHRMLPHWYPRELMGTPYRANLQNFPLIPTRLLLLAMCDPEYAMGPGAAGSAALAAIFTLLFCRRLGLGRIASAAAGFTFACCGFYASRILAGHLPLLEAYPALPALLWLTDRAIDPNRRSRSRFDSSLIVLGLTATCFALAGHPQLTVYALGFSSLYAISAYAWRRGIPAILAMALGVGVAGFALYPMAQLTGRTTRVLPLERASNDLAMPIARLGAMLFPWKDGWPPLVDRKPNIAFDTQTYPDIAMFWDTVCYIGWAPMIALFALFAYMMWFRAWPTRRTMVLAGMGLLALLLALPLWQNLMAAVPGTFLRSPARLMYVVGFSLSLALAGAIHLIMQWRVRARAVSIAIAFIVLGLHVFDLRQHARAFQFVRPRVSMAALPEERDRLLASLREGRIGFDYELSGPLNRAVDDIGFFDSIILAKPYRFVLDTSGIASDANTQAMNGAHMAARTLRACGVRLLYTRDDRPDLLQIGPPAGGVFTYGVRDADQRCEFFSLARVQYETESTIHNLLRVERYDLSARLLLDPKYRPATLPPTPQGELAAELRYKRVSPDEMLINITTNQPGYARILESWDTGWQATVDGAPAPVMPGNDVFITVPMPEGKHELRLLYRTPGATTGAVISLVAIGMLITLGVVAPRVARTRSTSTAT